MERTKVPENAILVSMDITSLYTNIPQEREYIRYARHTTLYKDTPPIPIYTFTYLTSVQAATGELVPVLYQIDI